MPYRIAPSLLAADFACLGAAVESVETRADFLHLDVMDGHFVPNISFGMPVIAALRPRSRLRFDCHVMTTNPHAYLAELAEAGVDRVSVHIEAAPDPRPAAAAAAANGLGFGIVVSPDTPWEQAEPFAELCDMIVIMSVRPGHGGQVFMSEVLPKLETARKWLDSQGIDADIEIDGGVTVVTAPRARDAGATVFVAGTSVFGAPDPAVAIEELRDVIEGRHD